MIGILVILVVSWGLLYLTYKRNLLVLGVLPIPKRVSQFIFSIILSAILCALAQYIESLLKSSRWVLNEDFTVNMILPSFWWDMKSVLTEELVFRGALLFILIKKLGANRGVIISAVAFGVYHWFSSGALGNPMLMVIIFFVTGLMGYVWALAYAKTESIMLPFGLHLGWNFIQNTMFSKGPLGDMILISEGGVELTGWISLINFVGSTLVVFLATLLYVKYFVDENTKKI